MSSPQIDRINQILFSYPDYIVYAIVDGASAEGLLDKLAKTETNYKCLFSGDLSPELASASPYLIQMEKNSPVFEWLVSAWGEHYGIYAIVPNTVEFEVVRKHFRTFLLVVGPDKKQIFFRYYDPRVFRVYLPTCDMKEANFVFGPLHSYVLEGENNEILKFWLNTDEICCQRFT